MSGQKTGASRRKSSALHKLTGIAIGGIAIGAVGSVAYDPVKTKVEQWLDELGEYAARQAHRLLKTALGMDIQADQMHLSLLTGRFSARGGKVTAYGATEPLVTIDALEAALRAGQLLKGMARMSYLRLEHPVISVVRRADGSLNVPGWLLPPVREIPRKAEAVVEAAEAAADVPLGFDARRIAVRRGEAHFRDQASGGYHVAATGIEARLTHAGPGYDVLAQVRSIARRDQFSELGGSHVEMRLEGIDDLSEFADAEITGHFRLPQDLEMALRCPSPRSRHIDVHVNGSAELAQLVPLIPPGLSSALAPLSAGGTHGRVSMSVQLQFDPERGLRVQHLRTDLNDVAVGTAAQTDAR